MISSIFSLFSILCLANDENGIRFFSGSWEDAKRESRKTGKPIFIDFYADWCGPCKWMERDIFTDEEVGEYFNANFINMRIDAERDELDLVEFIDLEAYPTLVYFDSEGKILLKSVGALGVQELIESGEKAIKRPSVKSQFDEDPTNYDNLVLYIETVDDDQAEELAIKYLNSLPTEEWRSSESWNLISGYITDFRSDVVRYVIENDEYFSTNFDGYTEFILQEILSNILQTAIDEEDLELLQSAIDVEVSARKLGDLLEYPEEYYSLETQYMYYLYTDDNEMYFEKVSQLVQDYLWEDSDAISNIVVDVAEQLFLDEEYMGEIIRWVIHAIEIDSNWHTQFAASYCYYMIDEYSSALEHAQRSKRLNTDEGIEGQLEEYIDQIKSEI